MKKCKKNSRNNVQNLELILIGRQIHRKLKVPDLPSTKAWGFGKRSFGI